jgi:hypothetical protein
MSANGAICIAVLYAVLLLFVVNIDTVFGILPFYASESDGILWVVSESKNETHAMACRRVGAMPISSDVDSHNIQITWDDSKVSEISSALDCVNSEEWRPVQGCCTPGLWFNKTSGQCFTHSYGSTFANYGWFDGESYPIYSCSLPTNETSSGISLLGASYWSGTHSVSLYGHGLSSSSHIEVGNQFCANTEVCGDICQSCDRDHPCDPDSLCLDIWRAGPRCYPACAGSSDTSCPCGTTCIAVSDTPTLHLHVCVPMTSGSGDRYKTHQQACEAFNPMDANHDRVDMVNCKLSSLSAVEPYTVIQQPSKLGGDAADIALLEVTVTTDDSDFASITIMTPASVLESTCEADEDCFDGDMCTVEYCSRYHGQCVMERLDNCVSSSRLVQQQQTPYLYFGYSRSAAEDIAMFESQMLCGDGVDDCFDDGAHAILSHTHDNPVATFPLHFSFPFFGNVLSTVTLNPYGLLQLPPVLHSCSDYRYPLKCMVYSTDANVVSLWATDWDYGLTKESSIWVAYSKSSTNDDTEARSAVHVLYENAPKSMSTTSKYETPVVNMSTFSASLYDDGSIKVRYHSVATKISETDVFGLQGSRLSSSLPKSDHLSTRYHNEPVDASLVQSSTELTFCLANTIGCVVNSCVSPGETMAIQWWGHSCNALNTNISLLCSFGGGMATSVPEFEPSINSDKYPGTLRCQVPELGLSDGTLFSVDIVVSVDASFIEFDSNANKVAVHGVYRSQYNEIAHAALMGRYYGITNSKGADHPTCGCNAVPNYESAVCDAVQVCGGVNETKDCAGEGFGGAYYDSCGNCTGGSTGLSAEICMADASTTKHQPPDMQTLYEHLPSWLDLFLYGTIILGMMIISSMVLHLHILIRQGLVPGRGAYDFELARIRAESFAAALPNPSRGLSAIEIDALGDVKYGMEGMGDSVPGDIELGQLASPESKGEDTPSRTSVKQKKTVSFQLDHSIAPMIESRDSSAEPIECSICLFELEFGQDCRRLPAPCGHIFHKSCIDSWLQVSTHCPMCKRSIRNILTGENESDLQLAGRRVLNYLQTNILNAIPRRRDAEVGLELLPAHERRSHDGDDRVDVESQGHAGVAAGVEEASREEDSVVSRGDRRRSIIRRFVAHIARIRRSQPRYSRISSPDISLSTSLSMHADEAGSGNSIDNPIHPTSSEDREDSEREDSREMLVPRQLLSVVSDP